jgi:hypothetical protein
MTIQEVEDIFLSPESKSKHVEEINKSMRLRHIYEENHYKHPFYPCIRDRGKDEQIRWGCEIHRITQNVHFDTIIHHMLFFEPDKHKEYILKSLKQF